MVAVGEIRLDGDIYFSLQSNFFLTNVLMLILLVGMSMDLVPEVDEIYYSSYLIRDVYLACILILIL